MLLDKILSLPKIEKETSSQLKNLHDTVFEAVMQIKNLDVDVASWSPILNHILLRKLDKTTVVHYECQLANVRETQSLEDFMKYIE